jgi:RimJ/RimL family protein N-acetyltransferase
LQIADLPMLHAWLRRPHVSEWWGSEDHLTCGYIALLRGEPIGFIQSYEVMGCGGGWWEQETDPGARGIDQFLANPEQLGLGLGSAMVRAFVERLFLEPQVTKVQADPSPDNQRAVRSYLRAGFVAHGEVMTPDGPALLMLHRRSTKGDSL